MSTPPTDTSNTRRLMAVMFTDIKGYSSMMGADESATVELVLEHREIVRACIAQHEGHEHETIGDAFVVLFESVVNAVKCAIDMQKRLAERNEPLPEDRQVWIRIGIHLGDIILRDGGIYGDAVNLAARVEGRAQPGGVCVTEQVKMHLGQRIDVPLISMGKMVLKGIVDPPELFRLDVPTARGPVAAVPQVAESAAAGRKLVAAAAVLALVVGAVFAMNADFGAAKNQPAPRVAPVPAKKVAAPAEAKKKEPAADKKAPAAVDSAPVKAQADPAAQAKLAAELVTAASAESGSERVRLLQEALKLDPDNTAYKALLHSAELKIKRAHSRKASKRARPAVRKATPTPAAAPAPPPAPPKLPAKPRIQRHVVED